MKKEQITAQMYTIMDYIQNLNDFEESCMKLANIGFKSVQLSAWGPDLKFEDMKKIFDDNGLKCDSIHPNSEKILNEPEKIVEELNILGAKYVAYPYPANKTFKTRNQVMNLCEKLNNAGKVLYENDKVLCYHNHHIEFLKVNEEIVLDMIYNNTNPKYLQGEIDTYWVQVGGQCSGCWCNKLTGRLPLLHLKDYGVIYGEGNQIKTIITEVGNGNLNWKKICKMADAAGTEWFIIEQDTCPGDPFDSLKMSYDYLVNNICED